MPVTMSARPPPLTSMAYLNPNCALGVVVVGADAAGGAAASVPLPRPPRAVPLAAIGC